MAYGKTTKKPTAVGSSAQKAPSGVQQFAPRMQDQFSPQAQAQTANPQMDAAYQAAVADRQQRMAAEPAGAPQGYAQPAQIDMSQMMASGVNQAYTTPAASQAAMSAKARQARASQGFQQQQAFQQAFQGQSGQRAQGGQKMPMNAASPAAQDMRAMQDRRAGGNVDAYGARMKNQMSRAASGGMTPAMGAAQRMKNQGGARRMKGAL